MFIFCIIFSEYPVKLIKNLLTSCPVTFQSLSRSGSWPPLTTNILILFKRARLEVITVSLKQMIFISEKCNFVLQIPRAEISKFKLSLQDVVFYWATLTFKFSLLFFINVCLNSWRLLIFKAIKFNESL